MQNLKCLILFILASSISLTRNNLQSGNFAVNILIFQYTATAMIVLFYFPFFYTCYQNRGSIRCSTAIAFGIKICLCVVNNLSPPIFISFPTFHNLIVLSKLALIKYFPSLESPRQMTQLLCPVKMLNFQKTLAFEMLYTQIQLVHVATENRSVYDLAYEL